MHTLPSCMEDDVTFVVVLVVMVAVMVAGIGEQPSAPMPLPVLPVLQVQTIFSVVSLHKAFWWQGAGDEEHFGIPAVLSSKKIV